jgi:hypothetical protein
MYKTKYTKYNITNYTRKKAKKLGVVITHSTNTKKKLDVFKKGKKVCSVGNLNYDNYPTHIIKRGSTFAKIRRKFYKNRHSKDRKKGCGFYADQLLW